MTATARIATVYRVSDDEVRAVANRRASEVLERTGSPVPILAPMIVLAGGRVVSACLVTRREFDAEK